MKKKYTIFCYASVIFSLIACTKQAEPIVTELEVVPKTFSINSPSTLTKPFTVRAKYSDNKIENVTKKVQWISENSALIEISSNGELLPKNACEILVCIVSLVVTHPESGKSQRVEVKLFPGKKIEKVEKKSLESVPEPATDKNTIDNDSSVDKSSETINDSVVEDDISIDAGKSALMAETTLDPGSEPSTASSGDSLITMSFSSPSLQLRSGQVITPDVISELDKSNVPLINFTCELEYSDEDALAIENGCNLRALAPGKARIKLVSNNSQYISNSFIELEVLAWEVANSQVSSLNFVLEEAQSQIWLKVLGVIPGEVIRYSAKGLFNSGFQLFVLNSLQDNQGACFNTAPADSNEVACIVKPLFSEIFLVLHKPQVGSVMANISISLLPAEVMAYSQANSADNPQELVKDNKLRSYVLANEFGLYNRHFYQYSPGLNDKNGFRVVLTEYEAQPLIEIFWANGFCTDKMLKVTSASVSCDIPDDRVGNVWITISGNMGSGGLNGPAAKKGGTYYSVLVTNKEIQ